MPFPESIQFFVLGAMSIQSERERDRDRQTDRETDRETERDTYSRGGGQTEIERQRQTDRERQRQRQRERIDSKTLRWNTLRLNFKTIAEIIILQSTDKPGNPSFRIYVPG